MTETLWDFAASTYQRTGVAECCLRLQDDADADVNMLLSAAWLAEQGLCWRHEEVYELVARCKDWRERCLLPLRAVRRYLKDRALYEQAKALELDAEMHQLHLLSGTLQFMSLKKYEGASMEALTANLQIYLDCLTPNRSAMADDLYRLVDTLRR